MKPSSTARAAVEAFKVTIPVLFGYLAIGIAFGKMCIRDRTSVDVSIYQGERDFVKDNKQLGMFRLDGIPAAPRGVPQIEVTFDIDANGIVHVSAKDLGTGKAQNITITSATNMSSDEIDKAVKEAERFAEEDKKRKEEIEIRNNADQMVYQSEKTLKEMGDKISDGEKSEMQSKICLLYTSRCV